MTLLLKKSSTCLNFCNIIDNINANREDDATKIHGITLVLWNH